MNVDPSGFTSQNNESLKEKIINGIKEIFWKMLVITSVKWGFVKWSIGGR